MPGIITVGSVAPPPSGRPPDHHLVPGDVAALADELVAYHAEFAPLLQRAEQRTWALAYLQGQLLDLERKSIEPMALALDGGDVQAMQQFISKGAWDDDRVLAHQQRLVADTLGDAETGVLILDGCDFPKQGTIRSASPASGAARSARSPTVRPVSWRAMRARTAIPWWIGASTCTKPGSRPSIAHAGKNVAFPTTSRSGRARNWPRSW